MISYLNGSLARDVYQHATSNERLSNFISSNLRKLFPTKKIPKPIFLQGYYWEPGVHIYAPGINPEQQVKYWTRPGSDPLWVIGESYSKYQGWMEGSLSSAEIAVRQLLIRLRLQAEDSQSRAFQIIPTKIPVNLPDYTLSDVSRHNTRDDAWIALFGYVYDVTDWISVHPGGDAILKGIGKEYSREWKQVSAHRMRRSDIRNLLNKYLVGRYVGSGINKTK
jgi:predicted heme/steroid binding protein